MCGLVAFLVDPPYMLDPWRNSPKSMLSKREAEVRWLFEYIQHTNIMEDLGRELGVAVPSPLCKP